MLTVKILGSGCANCRKLEAVAREAAARSASSRCSRPWSSTNGSSGPIPPNRIESNRIESNRIWIAGKPMEEWLGTSVGESPCCSVCGDLPCRTVEVGGQRFETIPEDLVVKAALMAASRMIGPSSAS